MFGDPVKNPFGWPTMTLDQATKEIVSGQCLNGDAGKLQPGQKAVLKVSAVTYGSFDANCSNRKKVSMMAFWIELFLCSWLNVKRIIYIHGIIIM